MGFAVRLRSTPSRFCSLLHHREFSDRGCFDATRRNAIVPSLFLRSRDVCLSFSFVRPSAIHALSVCRSLFLQLSFPRGLSSRLKTVRCTGDPTRAYSPSMLEFVRLLAEMTCRVATRRTRDLSCRDDDEVRFFRAFLSPVLVCTFSRTRVLPFLSPGCVAYC